MIDGGVILILVSALLAFAGPTEKLIVHRRNHRVVLLAPPLAAAFPFVPPSAALDELAREAEAAIEEDDLMRGVRAIGEIYDPPAE